MRIFALALQALAAGCGIAGAGLLFGVGGSLLALCAVLALVGAVLERGAA